jgi:hypothetical protein
MIANKKATPALTGVALISYESRGPASPALYKRRRKRGFILSLS